VKFHPGAPPKKPKWPTRRRAAGRSDGDRYVGEFAVFDRCDREAATARKAPARENQRLSPAKGQPRRLAEVKRAPHQAAVQVRNFRRFSRRAFELAGRRP
jgi:hypothetical protein